MKNFSDIQHRIKSVSDTRKITGAMETISVAKMRKAYRRYENNKAYFETIRKAIGDIVLYTKQVDHKVFASSACDRPALIVIASDKGLAGGFNHNVLEFARKAVAAYAQPHVFAVGQVCREFFASRNIAVDGTFADASFDPSVEQAAEISECIYKMYEGDEINCAYILYTAPEGQGKMLPEEIKLLPFDRDSVVREQELCADKMDLLHELEYEPSAEEVLAQLIPQYLTGMIYGALIRSSAAEHSQRRSAMNSATRNATEILEDLHLQYNRARQESVTDELSEIVTAAIGVQYEQRK